MIDTENISACSTEYAYSPINFIFWLNRLIFSVSINSHSDNIYLYRTLNRYYFVAYYCM